MALHPDGSLEVADRLPLCNPAYVRVDTSRTRAYVALERDRAPSEIAVVRVDSDKAGVSLIGTVTVPGSVLCHLDLHPSGHWIAGACYGSGDVFVRAIGSDGMPADAGPSLRRVGASIHPVRQTTAHPHAVRFSPDGRWLVVPDLGTDEVAIYAFDAVGGTLGGAAKLHAMSAGSGPRMVLFDSSGRTVVLAHELSSTVTSWRWADGDLRQTSEHSTLLAPFPGENTAAGLRWHPGGSVFAVSNRGADRIALFHFDAASSAIRPWCEVPSGGAKPRDFEFTPCGRWLLVANQDGDSLVVYALDADAGSIRDTGNRLTIRSPSCVRVAGGPKS